MNRALLADTPALILFFTFTGIADERFVAGMGREQMLHPRLLGAALMIPVGRRYGLWRDWVMRHARPDLLSRVLWDSFALVSFQVSIYAAIIAANGASRRGLLLGSLGATAIMLACGSPYGAFLTWVRSALGIRPGRVMPTSPDTRS